MNSQQPNLGGSALAHILRQLGEVEVAGSAGAAGDLGSLCLQRLHVRGSEVAAIGVHGGGSNPSGHAHNGGRHGDEAGAAAKVQKECRV